MLLRFKDRIVQIVMQRSLRSQAKLHGKARHAVVLPLLHAKLTCIHICMRSLLGMPALASRQTNVCTSD